MLLYPKIKESEAHAAYININIQYIVSAHKVHTTTALDNVDCYTVILSSLNDKYYIFTIKLILNCQSTIAHMHKAPQACLHM